MGEVSIDANETLLSLLHELREPDLTPQTEIEVLSELSEVSALPRAEADVPSRRCFAVVPYWC